MENVKRCPICKDELSSSDNWKSKDGCTAECRIKMMKKVERSWRIGDYKKIVKSYLNNLHITFMDFMRSFRRKPLPYRDYIPTEVTDKSKRLSSKKKSMFGGITKVGSIGKGLDIEIDGRKIKSEGTVWYEG